MAEVHAISVLKVVPAGISGTAEGAADAVAVLVAVAVMEKDEDATVGS